MHDISSLNLSFVSSTRQVPEDQQNSPSKQQAERSALLFQAVTTHQHRFTAGMFYRAFRQERKAGCVRHAIPRLRLKETIKSLLRCHAA